MAILEVVEERLMATYIDGIEQNPWGLTPSEVKAMDAMIKYGCAKRAGRALNLSPLTIKDYTHSGGRKICPDVRLLRYIAWSNWRNGVME